MITPPTDDVPAPRRPAQRWLAWARIATAPVLVGLVLWLSDPRAALAAARDASVGWLLAGLLCSLCGNLVSALRWRHLIHWLGHEVSRRWAVAVIFRALAIGSVMPGATVGGDLFRIWRLHRHGCPGSTSSTSVVLDRLSGLWMLWALGAAGLAGGLAFGSQVQGMDHMQHLVGLPAGLPLLPLAGTVVLVLLLLPLLLLVVWRARPRWLQQAGAPANPLPARPPHALRAYAWQAVVSLVVQVCSVAAFACAAHAFGVGLPLWLVAVTAAPIFLLASLPVSFGGWGTREVATVTAWAAFGVPAAQSVSTSIAFGIYALLQAALGLLPVPEGTPGARTSPDGVPGRP